MPVSRLGPLQYDLLMAFGRRVPAFFLTGGAALAHYYLGHRETEDLDFFVCSDILPEGVAALKDAAEELGASVSVLTDARDFKRYLVSRGPESIKVDLVHETQPQIASKAVMDGIAVDKPEEILANKLTPSVLSRGELRDLVDIWYLEKLGLRMEDALPGAMRKEVFTPAELASVLSMWTIGPDARPPGELTAEQLRAYVQNLADRLVRMAFPSQE